MKPTVDILLNPHPRVTEVTAVVLPGEGLLRAAWADATPEREAIHLGTVDPDGRLREEDGWDGIQPRLASLGGRLALLFLGAPDLRPTLVLDGGEPLVLGQAPGHQPCLAGGAKDAWAAWCEHDPGGPGWQVLLGRLQADGRFEHVARVPGTACGLGSAGEEARLIWVADGEVRCARLGEQGPGETEVVALDTRAELPVLAADAAGRWYAAWQGPYAHGVLRWPRLARREEDGRWRRLDPPLPLEDMHLEREDAGEDQGWEAPALLCHGGGGPWLPCAAVCMYCMCPFTFVGAADPLTGDAAPEFTTLRGVACAASAPPPPPLPPSPPSPSAAAASVAARASSLAMKRSSEDMNETSWARKETSLA